jgi:HSP20 family protein
MAFARWDPIRDLLAIQQRLERYAPGPAGWVPPVDLHETPDAYVVIAEVPGLKRDDLHIDMREGHLTVSGSRREQETPCEQYHCVERGHGTFSRTFHLPVPVAADRIAADLRDGVLTITCPKIDNPVRRIPVT